MSLQCLLHVAALIRHSSNRDTAVTDDRTTPPPTCPNSFPALSSSFLPSLQALHDIHHEADEKARANLARNLRLETMIR